MHGQSKMIIKHWGAGGIALWLLSAQLVSSCILHEVDGGVIYINYRIHWKSNHLNPLANSNVLVMFGWLYLLK